MDQYLYKRTALFRKKEKQKVMGILDNLEASIEREEPYKIACSKCLKLFIKSNDAPFICLLCSQ